jgi:Beta/Gamma crystallin
MKRILLMSCVFTLLQTISGQEVKFYSQYDKVIIYEHNNFGGQSKSFEPGDYRFFSTADFNDLISSIKVPNGMVAVIYEHANEKGGYGNYIDLMEDCTDLSVYDFNDKTSYLRVFKASRPGYIYMRNRRINNQFVAGHWERLKANSPLPNNSPPAVSSSLPPTTAPKDDIENAPLASQAEIDEFMDIQSNQLNVGVLGGETTKPFYYHHNQPGEEVYKYNKAIDPARLPGGFFNWVSEQLGWAGFVAKPFEVVSDIGNDIKDFIFGSASTKMKMDCWFPVAEFRKTVCGQITKDTKVCDQDYLHTKVTIDKDVCYYLKPSENFKSFLTNRWTKETHDEIEGEVKPVHLTSYNPATQKSIETTTPRNPLLLQIKKDEITCLYGPWMGDILDIGVKVPVPLSQEKLELENIYRRANNEIHPVNQLWRKKGSETQLIAIVDGTGYFQKKGNNEVEASGLNQRMRFYIGFTLPPKLTPITNYLPVYEINGVGFDFTDNPVSDIQPETFTLMHNGVVRVKVNDNFSIRNQKTHRVFFDKVRKRPNGVIQGYIVVETEPITKQGGSLNIIVKDITSNNSPVNPERPPVERKQQ